MRDLYIGLMSGTSMDGVDGVLADLSSSPTVLAHASAPFPEALRDELMALNSGGDNELHRAALAANGLVRVYAHVVQDLLRAAKVAPQDVKAIAAHGQTVRHRPRMFDGTGYTIQLNQPALLAELTGIDVAADFRSRDVAAGGQGAPLAPFFHQAVFARSGETVGVLNIGGISNLTVLKADGSMLGFDCGPGNALMDFWCKLHTQADYDDGGRWAAKGHVVEPMAKAMLRDPYFAQQPPKSTGRDHFNQSWLEHHLRGTLAARAEDVQATLAELTARACAQDAHRYSLRRLVVCGGGALNAHLMSRLAALLPGVQVQPSSEAGVPPRQVEALAFAWLARKTVQREKLDLQSTTGASGARVLGCIYPA
ncbi:anhydro-N-acetylmuramic acid kinase [Ramlibacter albus]|uniref:Anhydro-N-acetylmuramic acid kinase n=1 Tax=Ramlibacter albus TaxID=2079448 RepID=A0A923M7P6_9BURK|nr:anhydro-N-acetylmuramic acid kinase [Ramlibacter albus]MBC5764905.1 anhydro-N-acetylmuramic acid kinase [Ramlibacter albus]